MKAAPVHILRSHRHTSGARGQCVLRAVNNSTSLQNSNRTSTRVGEGGHCVSKGLP